ncbi:MAG: OmpH family outer membrane protein [Prevotella sp.]|jgi:outer membrane protein|nr:OmpH family outer membrane protein [Prevotella sp.]
MKNLSSLIMGVLAVAIVILYILHFTGKGVAGSEPASLKFKNDSTIILPIAYVDVDTLLSKYAYAKEIRELLLSKSENAKASLTEKQRKLASEQQEFQRKAQNNAFISDERAQSEYQRIQKLGADLEQTAARLDNELAMEQLKYNAQLADSVKVCIEVFNQTTNYQIILSNSGLDNVLFADEKYNITNQVLNLLNSRYIPAKK